MVSKQTNNMENVYLDAKTVKLNPLTVPNVKDIKDLIFKTLTKKDTVLVKLDTMITMDY